MDWTGYTPIYIRVGGNDANDGLTVGAAKATVQSAFDAALAGSGDYVLDVGAGTFAGVALSANWPVRIGVRGAGVTASLFGGIDGSGADTPDNSTPATAGRGISVISDKSVNLGAIVTLGGSDTEGYGTAANGGSVTLVGSVAASINSSGGDAPTAGSVAGNAGVITVTDCVIPTLASNGGDAVDTAGNGAAINATDCVIAGQCSSAGGEGTGTNGTGGSGGSGIYIRCSLSGNISAEGGESGYLGGGPGNLTFTDCAFTLPTQIVSTESLFEDNQAVGRISGTITLIGDTWPVPACRGRLDTTNLLYNNRPTPTSPSVLATSGLRATGVVTCSYAPSVRAVSTLGLHISMVPTLDVDSAVLIPETAFLRSVVALTVAGEKMTLDRLMTQIYNVWGMEVKSARDITFARGRVLEIINGALQVIYSRAKELDYFSRVPGTLTFGVGVTQKPMPEDLQSLAGHVRTDAGELRAATSREEFDAWSTVYFGGEEAGVPRVYWLEKKANLTDHDSAACVLHITPAPTEETTVLFDYAQEAPYFRESAFHSGARLQIPHSYVETLLLPICKYRASIDNLFRGDQAFRQAISAEYQQAMMQLGMVDPDTKPTQQSRREAAVTK